MFILVTWFLRKNAPAVVFGVINLIQKIPVRGRTGIILKGQNAVALRDWPIRPLCRHPTSSLPQKNEIRVLRFRNDIEYRISLGSLTECFMARHVRATHTAPSKAQLWRIIILPPKPEHFLSSPGGSAQDGEGKSRNTSWAANALPGD